MGDRGNIVVRSQHDADIYLYSHWDGSELPETLRRALAREVRWDDPAYLRRIVFCEMIKGKENRETGFAISTSMQDNEYPILIADTDKQNVFLENEPGEGHAWRNIEGEAKSYSFQEYIALPAASWGDLDSARKDE